MTTVTKLRTHSYQSQCLRSCKNHVTTHVTFWSIPLWILLISHNVWLSLAYLTFYACKYMYAITAYFICNMVCEVFCCAFYVSQINPIKFLSKYLLKYLIFFIITFSEFWSLRTLSFRDFYLWGISTIRIIIIFRIVPFRNMAHTLIECILCFYFLFYFLFNLKQQIYIVKLSLTFSAILL